MTYKQWSDEYYESAMNVKARIDAVREEMKIARADKLAELNNRLSVMLGMYYDCMDIARDLGRRQGEC